MFLPIDSFLFDETNLLIIHDNYPVVEQKDTRLVSVIFIRKLGDTLGLPYYTLLSACYYFHYFFMFYSMKKFSYIDVAITCILVATKSEETYRKIRQILTSSCTILNPDFQGIGSNSTEFDHHKKLVTTYERLLLDVIQFNFSCSHPHKYAFKLANYLQPEISNLQILEIWDLLQLVYCTEYCLRYPVIYFALSSAFLALRCKSYENPKNLSECIETEYEIVTKENGQWKEEFIKWQLPLDFLKDFSNYVTEIRQAYNKSIKTK